MENTKRDDIRTLFVCDYNAVRSLLAESLANQMTGKVYKFESAGVHIAPPDPRITKILTDNHLCSGMHLPRSLKEVRLRDFDHVIALSPKAWDTLLLLCEGERPALDYWYMPETAFTRPGKDCAQFDPELMLEFLELKIRHFTEEYPAHSVGRIHNRFMEGIPG